MDVQGFPRTYPRDPPDIPDCDRGLTPYSPTSRVNENEAYAVENYCFVTGRAVILRFLRTPEEPGRGGSDLCTSNAMTCAEIQGKMVLLMGVRDEELIQRLYPPDTGASLQDVVTCCRSFEATRHTASAIYSSPSQLRVMSTYKKGRRHDKTPHSPQQPPFPGQRVKTQHRTAVSQPCSPLPILCAASWPKVRPGLRLAITAAVKVIGRGLTNVPPRQPNAASAPRLATTTGSAATRLATMARVAR
ncbi:hypothetical protein GWK47_038032 [Chionoecetes opilio]|uniref:Uncharacterized protein n=1 Tax=Chionoecetes opilio TaxID=41210 RepID=A0A8J4YCZ9_CHIOP|nr:hypothetical protein GWK47_038032 [Chionoecetes opilio]